MHAGVDIRGYTSMYPWCARKPSVSHDHSVRSSLFHLSFTLAWLQAGAEASRARLPRSLQIVKSPACDMHAHVLHRQEADSEAEPSLAVAPCMSMSALWATEGEAEPEVEPEAMECSSPWQTVPAQQSVEHSIQHLMAVETEPQRTTLHHSCEACSCEVTAQAWNDADAEALRQVMETRYQKRRHELHIVDDWFR